MVRHAVLIALLVLGVGLQLFAVIGVTVMSDVFDRLHYAAAATTFGPFLIAAAILVTGSVGESVVKAFIVALVLVVGNPVLTHATARAARVRANQPLTPRPDEVERSAQR